ncbi:TIGR03773 family transporter-associated surface protein [Micromonospora craniellae]|uniref:Cell wall anchor protein n=1 Tax=Micromonospora craniellae TaxID=2294034 RepID=A0A372FT47_9ACTN|nr:TIGR03773 family transporter-associated surface protein [Micromonospora craniellae]QOC92501.1 TIGR03773 family transporter-associated surface protein [Micromonospora craniellae]RFS43915.1 cell wall anchor protein [Micromonospora craniellae]
MTAVTRSGVRATGRRAAAFVAALALAGLAIAPMPAAAAPDAAANPTEVRPAGADLVSVALDDGDLELRMREAHFPRATTRSDTTKDPSTVVIGPQDGRAVRVPDHPAFRFLGEPGRGMWALTAGDTDFSYVDTTGVRRGAVQGDTVELSVAAVEGPGDFAAYTLGGLGAPSPVFGTVEGMPRGSKVPAATRTGGLVWLFAAAGDYQVTVAATATTTNGEEVSTDAVYRVQVPPFEAPKAAPAAAPAPASTPLAARALPAPEAAQNGQPSTSLRAAPQVAPNQSATPPAPEARTANSGRVVIDDGHVDMGPQLDGDDLTIRLKDDTVTPIQWRNLADVVLHAKDNAKTEVPAGADFLGSPGDTVWLLPQAQQAGVVWPGWNTQHPSVISGTRGAVNWTFKGITGPGTFVLFLTGSFGSSEVLFNSADSLPQRLDIPANTHAHGNWAFSEPGIYRLAFEMSATTTAGKKVTDTKTLVVAVGDSTDPNTGFGPGSGNGGDDSGGGSGNGKLPQTGSSIRLPAFGLGLVVVGGTVLAMLRIRRRDQHQLG